MCLRRFVLTIFVTCLASPAGADIRVIEIEGPGSRASIKSEYITPSDESYLVLIVPAGQSSDTGGLPEAALYILWEEQWKKAPRQIEIEGPPVPPVIDYTLASDAHRVFMHSGLNLDTGQLAPSNEVYRMELEEDENQALILKTSILMVQGDGPAPRSEAAATWTHFPTEGFVICGGGGLVDQNWTYFEDLWHFDAETSTFTRGPDLPHPMAGHDIVALPDGKVLIAGWGPEYSPDSIATVICDLVHDTCQEIQTSGAVPPPMYGHHLEYIPSVAAPEPQVVLIGGVLWFEPIWRSEISIFHEDGAMWSNAGFHLEKGLSHFAAGLVPEGQKNSNAEILIFGGAENWFPPTFSNTTYLATFDGLDQPADYAVPAVARIQGAGAFFTSLMHLFNAGASDLELELVFTPRAGSGGEVTTISHSIPPGVLQTIEDPLETFFGFSGAAGRVGSVLITVAAGSADDLMVQTVVFARLDSGEEYGQFFPAMRVADAIDAGQITHLNTTEDSMTNRVNVGLMAVADGTRFEVRPVDPLGTGLAVAKTFDLGLGGNTQINNIHDAFGLGPIADVVVEVEVLTGSGLAYASVLDGNLSYGGTSDPTTILPVGGGSERVTLLEIGSIQGLNEFSGSAGITNYSARPATVRADFFQRGIAGVAATENMMIPAGDTLGYSDFAGDLFGIFGDVGTVVLTPTNRTLIGATGREFAIFGDNQGAVVGTAGQLIAGQTTGDRLNPGMTYHFIGLRQAGGGDAVERSHFAVFNPNPADTEISVRLYDGPSGILEGERRWIVAAETLIQVNNVIRQINPGHDDHEKRIEVEVEGSVFMSAFRVNRSGDPISLTPFEG